LKALRNEFQKLDNKRGKKSRALLGGAAVVMEDALTVEPFSFFFQSSISHVTDNAG
jgi:hypothetical protein